VKANSKPLNVEIIQSNLSEAIQELETLRDLASGGGLNEADFQVRLGNAEFCVEHKACTHVRNVPN
jgi:hypothetical protein